MAAGGFVFRPSSDKGTTFAACLARNPPNLRGLEAASGRKLPDALAAMVVKRAAAMTQEQRWSFHVRAPGHPSMTQAIETSRRLDRLDRGKSTFLATDAHSVEGADADEMKDHRQETCPIDLDEDCWDVGCG